MKLPEIFIQKMKELFSQQEWQEFLESFDKERFYGLRINTLKISKSDFLNKSLFSLQQIAWVNDGFYYSANDNPSKHPFHNMGLYYMQEPSAMLTANVLLPLPGEKVLDLCAAPGGKTVQLSSMMQNKGLLVSNDINPSRIRALVKNVELFGITNCVVTNESPQQLSRNFAKYFDKILIDAPCSGEGMFRKDKEAVKSYLKFNSEKCCEMQIEILHNADLMLKEEGIIAYSTCTFNPEENEKMMIYFSKKYYYEILEIAKPEGVSNGRPQWADNCSEISRTARIWPHKTRGEGHFVALLKKNKKNIIDKNTDTNTDTSTDTSTDTNIDTNTNANKNPDENIDICLDENQMIAYRTFEKKNLNIKIEGKFFTRGKHLYCLPDFVPSFNNLKVAKYGFFIGEYENGIFEISHSFLVAQKIENFKNIIKLPIDSIYVEKYLRGETLVIEDVNIDCEKAQGLVAVCTDGFPIGFGKMNNGILKNLYPKGWRKI